MDAKDSPVQPSSNQTWVEALAEYEAEIRRRHFLVHNVLRVLFLGWVMLWIFNPNLDWWFRIIGVGFLLWMLISQFRKGLLTKPEEDELLIRVVSIGLAVRITSGSLSNERIRRYTSRVQRWLFPKLRAGNKIDLLKRVGASLEWYLVPPGSHYRGTWTVGLLGVLGFLLLLGSILVYGASAVWSVLSAEFGLLAFLGLIGLLAGLNPFDQQITLIRYLKDQWKGDSPPKESSELEPKTDVSSSSVLHRDYNMDLVINLCDKELDKYKNYPEMSTFSILFVYIAFGSGQLTQGFSEITGWVLIGGLLLALTGLRVFLLNQAKKLKEVYLSRLKNSNLVARIAAGEATKAQLRTFIPRTVSWIPEVDAPSHLHPGEGADISIDIVCVALNLDWFLERPKTLVRPMWLWFCMLLLVGAYIATEKVTSSNAWIFIPTWAWAILGTAGLAFWITLLQASVRMRAGSLALIEHLREGRS